MNSEVETGCNNVIQELKNDFEQLKGYRIPPQFFGPAAAQASKGFTDGAFEQFDFECMNYNIDLPSEGQTTFAKETPIEAVKKVDVTKLKPKVVDYYVEQAKSHYINVYVGKKRTRE